MHNKILEIGETFIPNHFIPVILTSISLRKESACIKLSTVKWQSQISFQPMASPSPLFTIDRTNPDLKCLEFFPTYNTVSSSVSSSSERVLSQQTDLNAKKKVFTFLSPLSTIDRTNPDLKCLEFFPTYNTVSSSVSSSSERFLSQQADLNAKKKVFTFLSPLSTIDRTNPDLKCMEFFPTYKTVSSSVSSSSERLLSQQADLNAKKDFISL